MLRVRRKIAEGELDPKQVIIYWIEEEEANSSQQILPIKIDRKGEVSTWPEGVFSEDFEEARRIKLAQIG